MKPQSLTARAPAKLIISGEHSVLYDQPALAMAINRYTTTTTSWSDSKEIHFNLANLSYVKSHTVKTLRKVKNKLQQNYQDFLDGKGSISSVLTKPFDLLQYSVSNLLEYINQQLPKGVEIKVDSDIPIGCGLGSSAAAVLSSLYALANFLRLNWQKPDYLKFSRAIESLQHGKSSGLDLQLVTDGGCLLYSSAGVETRPAPSLPLYIVNTGKPSNSTGECVVAVADKMTKVLAAEFGEITREIDLALANNDQVRFNAAILDNHRLLQRIGVVPDKVARFIDDLAQNGAGAKICGAGAVIGDNAGIVLISSNNDVSEIITQHGYTLQNIEVDVHGIQII